MSSPRAYFPNLRLVPLLLTLSFLVVGGCKSGPQPPKDFAVVQFYMEAPPGLGVAFTLPESKIEYRRKEEAFMNNADVSTVNEGYVTEIDTNIRRMGVVFTFTPLQQHEVMIQTANNQGRRMFLFVNGQPRGVHLIDQVVQSGQLFFFVEVPDADPTKPEDEQKKLDAFVANLDTTQKYLEEMRKK